VRVHRPAPGVELTAADDVQVEPIRREPSPASLRGFLDLPSGPIPMPGSEAAGVAQDLLAAIENDGGTLVTSVDLLSLPEGRRGPAEPSPTLTVEVLSHDTAVVLLEDDGMFTWSYPAVTPAVPGSPGVRSASEPRKLAFDIPLSGSAAIVDRARGPLWDLLSGRIRAHVFKFLAGRLVRSGAAVIERNAKSGLVVMSAGDPASWPRIERLADILPVSTGRHVLLFVHGTFSSTAGSFGALAATEWGKEFLALAAEHYDLVVGIDHPTLGVDPLVNAADLFHRLNPTQASDPIEIDAVAYSRGALVLRSLIEHILPTSVARLRVRRAVFVGGTNAGTELAEPANWKRMADLYTNLAIVGSRVLGLIAPGTAAGFVLRESVATIGSLVAHLAEAGLEGNAVPGLAAMNPSGPFVRDINALQPGQPSVAESYYCVVRSDFDVRLVADTGSVPEFPKRLALWIVDTFADSLMAEPNDLVVNTASMEAIDSAVGEFIKDRLDFGRNPHVFHTNYFTRPELTSGLARWFGLDMTAESLKASSTARTRRNAALAGIDLPIASDTSLLVTRAEDPFALLVTDIQRDRPTYVVVDRNHGQYFYAFRSEEILEAMASTGEEFESLTTEAALSRVARLALYETTASPRAPAQVPDQAKLRGTSVSGSRAILFDNQLPIAVLGAPSDIVSARELARHGAIERSSTRSRKARPSYFGPQVRLQGSWDLGAARGIPAETGPEIGGGSLADDLPEGFSIGLKHEIPLPKPIRIRPLAERAKRFVRAQAPEQLVVRVAEPLSVTIAGEGLVVGPGMAGNVRTAAVDLGRPVLLQVVPHRNLSLVGDASRILGVEALRATVTEEFQIVGTDLGPAELSVILMQGSEYIAHVPMHLEVIDANVSPSGRAVRQEGSIESVPQGPAFPTLQIFEQVNGAEVRYHFALMLDDGSALSALSDPIHGDRDAYVVGLYKEIETRWLAANQDREEFERRLRDLGGQLLDELVPPDVRAKLWEMKDTLSAIRVYSAEPFIPWELLCLKPPATPGRGGAPGVPITGPFLAELGLVRWLHNSSPQTQQLRVDESRAWFAIPEYPHPRWVLPEAQAEIPFLESHFGANSVECSAAAIRNLMTAPEGVDLFHFSGHGQARGGNTIQAQIMLQGRVDGQSYIPDLLDSTTVRQNAYLRGSDESDPRRPIVILNACQVGRSGWQLTSIGGFADAFLFAGAGVFVGTLWSVWDRPSRVFSEAFYGELLRGSRLSEATRFARIAARSLRDATWLAYAVYGHPNAVLTVTKRDRTLL
jgi:hypothetical protein